MLYGEKKRKAVTKNGLKHETGKYYRSGRGREKHALRRFMAGVEDADIRYDHHAQVRRGDWDDYCHATKSFAHWAVRATAGVEDPHQRWGRVKSLIRNPHTRCFLFRSVGFKDEFATNRVWRDRYPARKEQVESEDARRSRILREIVESGWGHRLLNKNIHHRTCTWPVWKPNAPLEVWDGGRVKTILCDHFVDVSMGPATPRKLLGLGDIETFLRDLHQASRCKNTLESEEYLERKYWACKRWEVNPSSDALYIDERVVSRPNPDRHPEWLLSVDSFLNIWEKTHGDRDLVNQALRAQRLV